MTLEIPRFDSQSFKRLLVRNVMFPLVLSVLSTVMFIALIFYQISIQEGVERSIQRLAQASRVEKLIMNSETGMRGYLLAGRETFLEPFDTSSPRVLPELEDLRQSVGQDFVQLERVNEIESNFIQWLEVANGLISERKKGTVFDENEFPIVGKRHIDRIRVLFEEFTNEEELIKNQRNEEARSTTLYLVFLVLVIGLLFGVIIALTGRRQLLQLSKSYDTILEKQIEHNENLLKEQALKSDLASLSEAMVAQTRVSPRWALPSF